MLEDCKSSLICIDEHMSSFTRLLKIKWDKIHGEEDVFRYKINNLQERFVDKYIMILNNDRGSNRRTPEHIKSIRQPFNDQNFNFTKAFSKEIMFRMDFEGDEHTVLVNISPISRYHSLLCPSMKKKLPQVVTEDSLLLALNLIFFAQDCDLKIVFNSLCGFASVNHLHYHLIIEKHSWPVEFVKWVQVKKVLHCIQDYPVPAFCFEVKKESVQTIVPEVYKLIQYFLDKSIAHNILITMKTTSAAVYVWPRKSATGVKDMGEINVAACELSGWITVYSADAFQRLQSKDLETELKRWRIDNFEMLSREVELLY